MCVFNETNIYTFLNGKSNIHTLKNSNKLYNKISLIHKTLISCLLRERRGAQCRTLKREMKIFLETKFY